MKIREIRAAGPARDDARRRLEQRAPARRLRPHAGRRAHRRRAGRLRAASSPTTSWCARRWPCWSRSILGENALEPERVSEKLHQNTFWLGRGGSITHAISGIDIALWDILGKATGQPVGRLLGGRYRERVQPYASLLMEEPGPLAEQLLRDQGAGLPRLQDRLGAVRPRRATRSTRRSCARRAMRSGPTAADGGCRRQRRLLAAGLQVGAAHRARCWPTTTWSGSRSRSSPMRWRTTSQLRRAAPAADLPAARCSRGGRPSSRGWRPARSTSCSRT